MWNKHGFWFSAVMTLLLFLLGADSFLMNAWSLGLIIKELGSQSVVNLKLDAGLFLGVTWFLKFLVVVLCFIFAPNVLFKVIYPLLTVIFALFAFVVIPHPELFSFISREAALYSFTTFTSLWNLISLVFIWGYANSKFKLREASYYYYLWAAFAALLGYAFGKWLFDLSGAPHVDLIIPYTTLFISLAIIGLFWLLDSYASDELSNDVHSITTFSPKFFLYAFSLFILLVSFGFGTSLLELVWKNKSRLNYPDAAEYGSFISHYNDIVLWGSLIIAALMVAVILIFRKPIPWKWAAQATPWALLLIGVVFFTGLFFGELLKLPELLNATALSFSVNSLLYLFFIPQAFHKLLFGPSTSMAFIPFSYQVRFGLLALFILIFAGLGRFLGNVTVQLLILYFGTLQASEPLIALLFFVSVLIWIIAVIYLTKYVNRHMAIE